MQRKDIILGAVVLIVVVGFAAGLSFYNAMSQTTGSSGGYSLSMRNAGAPEMAPQAVPPMAAEAAMMGGDSAYMGVAMDSKAMIGRPIVPAPTPPPGFQTGGGEEFIPDQPLIIKTGYMSLAVADVPKAIDDIVGLIKTRGGEEVNRNVSKNNYMYQAREVVSFVGSVTVRVPSDKFEESLSALKQVGEVESQQVNAQDVTEEYVDIQAQLKNYRATEAQYLEIMKRAEKIQDVLEVQRELGNVRSQIDRLEGRTKYLQQSSAKSTITVNLTTKPENVPVVDEGDEWKPAVAFKDALRSLLGVGKSIGDALIWAVVYLPVALVVFIIAWILIRRSRRNDVYKNMGSAPKNPTPRR